jgi:hypothetical protein
MRDIEAIDSELRLVAVLRRAARERGAPLPSIAVASEALHLGCGARTDFLRPYPLAERLRS